VTDLRAVLLSTITLVVLTAIVFLLLALWSAGGAATWSIAAGVARGVRDWARGRDNAEAARGVSPQAIEPEPPIDTAALPLPPLSSSERNHEAWLEEGVDQAAAAEIEMEEIRTRRS
jgi:hypothetical protein